MFRIYLMLLIAVLVGTACGREGEKTGMVPAGPAVKVSAVTIHSEEREGIERVPGSVSSINQVTVESKISGRIQKLYVREGEVVPEGKLLVEIDAREIQAKLDQAIAAEKQARQDLERFTKLLPAGAVTKRDYDAVETRAHVATAGVAEASAMVSDRKILAPFAGVIVRKLADEGDLALPGKPLLTIERQDLFRFEADVPESLASTISLAKVLKVQLAGFDTELKGVVSEISPATDPNSRTQHLKLDLESHPIVRSGQFGYVYLPLKKRPSLQIPESAILQKGQMECVYIVRDGKASLRLVRTAKRRGGMVEVSSGLEEGEVLVVTGAEQLVDGVSVEITP